MKVNPFFLARCHYMRTSKSWHNDIKVENLEVVSSIGHNIQFPYLIAPNLFDLPSITTTLHDFPSYLPMTHPYLLACLKLFIILLPIFLRIGLRNFYSISPFCCQLISHTCLHFKYNCSPCHLVSTYLASLRPKLHIITIVCQIRCNFRICQRTST